MNIKLPTILFFAMYATSLSHLLDLIILYQKMTSTNYEVLNNYHIKGFKPDRHINIKKLVYLQETKFLA